MNSQRGRSADLAGPQAGTIEREEQLGQLAALAERAVALGRAAAAVVRGEPGIGKSTLLALAADGLGPAWSVVKVEGRALGVDRAYEAGRRLVRRVLAHPAVAADGPFELPDRIDDVPMLLTRVVAAGPLAIVVDDLHWIDDRTLDLLDLLRAELLDTSVLWLVGTRTVEAAGRPPVQALLHSLERDRATVVIDVPRLSRRAVGVLCAAAGEHSVVTADVVDRIFERSCGNPLVVDALLRVPAAENSGRGGHGPIPGYVREVFAGQLADLRPAERDLLLVVACVDAPLVEEDLVALGGALDAAPPIARSAVTALLGRRLLQRHPSGALSIGHPVIGELAIDMYRETALRHVAAVVIEHHGGVVEHLDVAGLVELAGDDVSPELAIRVLSHAAELAYAGSAGDLAARWLSDAVHHAGRVAPDERALVTATTLLREAQHLDGDPVRAASLAARAIVLAVEAARRDVAADAAIAQARARRSLGDRTGTLAAMDRAVELVRDEAPDVQLRVRESVLRQAVLTDMPVEDLRVMADELAARAVAHGRPERAEAAEALLRMRDLHRFGTEDWERLRTAAARTADGQDTMSADFGRIVALDGALITGEWAVALELLTDSRVPVWRRLLTRFELAFTSGRWDDAQIALDRAGTLVRHPAIRSAQAWFDVHRGRDVAVDRTVDTVAPELSSGVELAGAYAAVLHGATPSIPDVAWETRFLTMQEGRLRPALAEVCLAAGDAQRFALALARVEVMSAPGNRMEAAAAKLRGLAALRAGDHRSALAELRVAEEGFAALGMSFDAARCEVLRLTAVAHAASGASTHPTGADEAVDVARAAELAAWFDDIGAVTCAADARRLVGPSSTPPSAATGLTRRELEVARLVGAGRSNAQIAAELFVSVRTVTSHLDHAYTKLGIGSRAALAVYAHELERNT